MHFSSNLVIKKNQEYFIDLKNKFKLDYIDSYLMAGILGFQNNKNDVFNDEDKDNQSAEISIPRTVLISHFKQLDNLWSLIYMLCNNNVDSKGVEFYQKVFESNDGDISKSYLSIDRVQKFHSFAIAGVKILYDYLCLKNNQGISVEDCLKELIETIKIENLSNKNDDFLDI